MDMEISELLSLTYQLKQLLEDDARVRRLAQVEHELDQDIEVLKLSATMHRYAEAYSASLDNESLRSITQRQLHKAKYELESHPLVRRYYELYQPVRELFDLIQAELFAPFNLHVCGEDH
jgi:cell fate (sporulation/competence/biofilm development) regulator YlbF (YheA/YmcA/DUF963 family)